MEKNKTQPVSVSEAIFVFPVLFLISIGILIGEIVQPLISGFILGRKHSKKYWKFDDLENDD